MMYVLAALILLMMALSVTAAAGIFPNDRTFETVRGLWEERKGKIILSWRERHKSA